MTGFALLLAFTFGGTWFLLFFRITVDDLRIAGGLLLIVIALSIVLSGRVTAEPTVSSGTGIVPLASPLLVGPGAITAAVVLVGTVGMLIAALSVVLAFAVTWITLRFTTLIYRILGESGSDIIARILGIILAAIAVVYVREGIFLCCGNADLHPVMGLGRVKFPQPKLSGKRSAQNCGNLI